MLRLFVSMAVTAVLLHTVNADCDCQFTDGDKSATCSGCDEFPAEKFSEDIEIIRIVGNSLSSIPVLNNYTKLHFLDFSQNSISMISDGAFKECGLVTLNLTHNKLTTLTSEMFEDLSKLTHLHLGFNDIKTLTEADLFHDSRMSLLVLNFTNNPISAMNHNAISDLIELIELDFSDNDFETIDPMYFKGLNKLKWLHLQNNKVEKLEGNVFNDMDSIEMIDLRNNAISVIENMAFQGLHQSLQVLHLSYNRLDIIHEEFRMLSQLKNLYLDNNPITQFKENVLPPHLQVFHMENCETLEVLPNDTFLGVKQLQYLTIKGNNKLGIIDLDAFDLDGRLIRNVDLSHNALQHIDASTLKWQNVSNLDLSNNHWDCDCNIKWMKYLPNDVRDNVR